MSVAMNATIRKPWHARLSGLLFRYHRWFGLLSCLAVMSWGFSGVMHPLMSRLSPQAVQMRAPVAVLQLHDALPPAEVLARAGIATVAGLRVIGWEGASYYQVTLSDQQQRRYFDVRSGVEKIDGDAQFARHLARHFSGEKSAAISSSAWLKFFDDDYLSINRLLPVHRIDFARNDHLRAYIETSPPRLATLADDTKATLGSVFRFLHNWEFLDRHDTLRQSLISLLLGATLLSALSGLWMYGFMWQRATLRASHAPLRRWHRGLGITVSISALLFVISAEWHLLGSERRTAPAASPLQVASAQLLLPEALRHGTWSDIALVNQVSQSGRAHFRAVAASAQPPTTAEPAMAGEHDHHQHPPAGKPAGPDIRYLASDGSTEVQTGTPLDAERQQALQLATRYSKRPLTQITDAVLITRFEGEYGFLNKRLPVWRVNYATPDHASYYVETSSGALATVVTDSARAEGWSFSYLHKFHWLDFAGKDVRDFVMAVFGLGNLVVAVLGLWLFARRYR